MNPIIQISLVAKNEFLSAYIIYGEHLDYLGDISDNRREFFGLVGPKEILFTIENKLDEEIAEVYLNAFEQANYKYFIGDDLYIAL